MALKITPNTKIRTFLIGKEYDLIIERLSKNNIHTIKDFLSETSYHLMFVCHLSLFKIQDMMHSCSEVCQVLPKRLNSVKVNDITSTSLPELDSMLGGGLLSGSITEIFGTPGSGKTQLAFTLTITFHLQFPTKSIIYLDTESSFNAKRLVEIGRNNFDIKRRQKIHELCACVSVVRIETCAALSERLLFMENGVSEQPSLIILDSLAAAIRREYPADTAANATTRSDLINEYASLLKIIADKSRVPIVITNHITTRWSSAESELPPNVDGIAEIDLEVEDVPSELIASLGNTWHHCVTTRIFLKQMLGQLNQMQLRKSPIAPLSCLHYFIDHTGFHFQGLA